MATWIYVIATIAFLAFIACQYRETRQQTLLFQKQLEETRSSRDLESFTKFISIWDSPDFRQARRHVCTVFEKAVKLKLTDEIASNAEFEKFIGSMSDDLRQSVDTVINRANLAGLIWCGGFLTKEMREIVLPYIYKTVIVNWDCLFPYISHVRFLRRETPGGSITYANPFAELVKEAERLLMERKEARPLPSSI